MKNGSLRSKFILLTILVIIVPLVITNTAAVRTNRQVLQNSMNTLYHNNMISVGMSVENYVYNTRELSTYIIGNESIRDFLQCDVRSGSFVPKTSKAVSVLSSFPISSLLINKATVTSNAGVSINSNSYQALVMTQEQRVRAAALAGYGFWDLEKSVYGEDSLVFCRAIRDIRSLYKNLGYVKISLNMDSFRGTMTPQEGLENINYHIVDKSGTRIFSSDCRQYDAITGSAPYDFARQSLDTVVEEDNYFICGYPVSGTDWIIFSVAPDTAGQVFNGTFTKNMAVATILCIALCFLIAICFANIVTKPLVTLGKMMNSVSDGDFSNKLELSNYNELSALAEQFNQMNDKLNFLYNEVFQNEIRIKEAEFSALVAQMNPHFLYNTLDTIYWMSKSGDSENVSNMVSKLSRLLRLTLSGSKDNFVPLSTELEHLDCYLSIQKIRFQEQIQFSVAVDQSLRDCRVLKVILQPLIENAITHGINPVGSGTVTTQIYSEDGLILYKVSNSGKLLNISELDLLLSTDTGGKKGFALKNINERLRLTYGANYGLEYGFDNGQTYFIVRQPKQFFTPEDENTQRTFMEKKDD